MKVISYRINDALAVKISGEFDAHIVAQQRGEFEQFAAQYQDIVVDCSQVHFIDSSGIGVLVFLYKRLVAKSGGLVIVGLSGQPLELFQMLHMDRTLNCFSDMDEYLVSIGSEHESCEASPLSNNSAYDGDVITPSVSTSARV